jgi:hypothetical protein
MDVVIARMNELSDTELRVVLVIRYATTALSVCDIQTQTGRGRQVYIAIKELLKRKVIEKTNHVIVDNIHKWSWVFLWDVHEAHPVDVVQSPLLIVAQEPLKEEVVTTPKAKPRKQKTVETAVSVQHHSAVKAYVEVTHRRPKQFVAETIANAIGDNETDIIAWKDIVKTWVLSGWNPQNVDGMIDMFKNRNNQGGKSSNAKRRIVIDPKPNKTADEMAMHLAEYLQENEEYHEAN